MIFNANCNKQIFSSQGRSQGWGPGGLGTPNRNVVLSF